MGIILENTEQPYIAGFWRRSFAFLIDLLIVSLMCIVISGLLGNYIYRFPILFTLIGYTFVVAYFAICNSLIYKGHTFGKKMMSIKVVDLNHQYLPLSKSIVRAAVLYAPFCLSSLATTPYLWLNTLITIILGCLFFSIIYLFIFNRKNRRSTHDFLSYTTVVKEDVETKPITSTWKVHFYIVVVAVLLYSLTTVWNSIAENNLTLETMKNTQFNGLEHLQQSYTTVQDIEGNSKSNHYMIAMVNDPEHLNDPSYARDLATYLSKQNSKNFSSKDDHYIQMNSNFQFGVLSKLNSTTYKIHQTNHQIDVEEVGYSRHTTLGGRF